MKTEIKKSKELLAAEKLVEADRLERSAEYARERERRDAARREQREADHKLKVTIITAGYAALVKDLPMTERKKLTAARDRLIGHWTTHSGLHCQQCERKRAVMIGGPWKICPGVKA